MTINVEIEDYGEISLKFLVMDLNGTISSYGNLHPIIKTLIEELKKNLEIYLLSADTYGNAANIADDMGIRLQILQQEQSGAEEKASFVKKLGNEHVVALGNGRNDWKMLQAAKIGIGIIGEEGIAQKALIHSDLLVKSPKEALELLKNPQSLRATLRG
ncbi:MAG: hypothetical protein DRO88_03030 [Promethearchaeia archaeon]|nr:MAG: hypothetical protein DRO88_03030 [Candidatus Lokiarchaeia archaeon]